MAQALLPVERCRGGAVAPSVEGRWSTLFGEAKPEVETSDAVYRVRLPTPSLERANAICAAIKADGGGC